MSALLCITRGRVGLSVPGGTGLLGALVLLLVVEARSVRSHRDVESGGSPIERAPVRAVSFGVVLLALAAIVVILGADS